MMVSTLSLYLSVSMAVISRLILIKSIISQKVSETILKNQENDGETAAVVF